MGRKQQKQNRNAAGSTRADGSTRLSAAERKAVVAQRRAAVVHYIVSHFHNSKKKPYPHSFIDSALGQLRAVNFSAANRQSVQTLGERLASRLREEFKIVLARASRDGELEVAQDCTGAAPTAATAQKGGGRRLKKRNKSRRRRGA